MAIILDADVIIRGEKGTFDISAWLARHPHESFEIAAITIAELWHGVERASGVQKIRRSQFLQAVIQALPVVPYTEHTGMIHAKVWAELQAAGTIIGAYDLIVAATAIERGSTVATFNHKHFSVVPGLNVIVPQ
jgi:tRNA(fMet)-specific endonuclease VapC